MKTILKAVCAIVLGIMLLCLMYAHFNREGLSGKVLAALRKQLTTELQVSSFEMDLLSGFPRIRFEMKDVALAGKGGSSLLQAAGLQISVSMFSIFSDEIRFKKLLLKDGQIHVERLKDGTLSFDVLVPSNGKEAASPSLQFNTIELENIVLHYSDPGARQTYQCTFRNGTLSASFHGHGQQLDLELDSKLLYEYARLGKISYLNGMEGEAEGKITLDLEAQLYTFDRLALTMDELVYEINGSVRQEEAKQYIDLSLRQPEGDMHSFLKLLPVEYRKQLPFTDVKGDFVAEGSIRGWMSKTENPEVQFDVSLKNGRFESPNHKGSLEGVEIHGTFGNGKMRSLATTNLDMRSIEGKAYGQKFDASLNIADFNDPVFSGTFDGSLPASFILDYSGMTDAIEKITGALHFDGIRYGPLRSSQIDFTDMKKMHGRCTIGNVVLYSRKQKFEIPDGQLTLSRDTLTISDLSIQREQDKVHIDGWFADLGDAMESGDIAYLDYELAATAGSLNITDWLPGVVEGGNTQGKPIVLPVSSKVSAPLRLPSGTLELKAERFQYDQVVAKSFELTGTSGTSHVEFAATGESAKGTLHAKGKLGITNRYALSLQLEGEEIDIKECFAQCENFSQKIVRAENLKGKGDIRVIADLAWTSNNKFLSDEMHVLAGMSVRDGELQDFEMLNQFSDYVHAEDLRHIRFARIDNFIEIRDGNVFIPAMFIQSNAMNLVLNGVHRLDNHILYNLKLNAGQIAAAKMKKHNPALAPLPARKEGMCNLFFTLSGTVDEFAYDLNKRAVESSFEQSMALRAEISRRLREVFGESIDMIESPDWETIPEFDLERKGEDTFLDFED